MNTPARGEGAQKGADEHCETVAVKRAISPRDAMYNANPDMQMYLRQGETAVKALHSGLAPLDFRPTSILDYGCGYGRITRWFRRYWPDCRLVAADISGDQIEFCAREFDAEPVLIDKPAAEIMLPEQYDLIWLGSVFTHLPMEEWFHLLNRLRQFVKPGGMLSFSFAGRTVFETLARGNTWLIEEKDKPKIDRMIANYREDGFGFYEHRKGALGRWGRSIAKPEWVVEFCRNNGGKIIYFSEAAYAGRQDIIIVTFPS